MIASAYREHALLLDIGRSTDDMFALRQALGERLPLGHARGLLDLGMGYHAQYSGPQFPVEAVHHGKHENQHRHAERQAQHGGQGNEGDEVVAPLGANIAQPDQ